MPYAKIQELNYVAILFCVFFSFSTKCEFSYLNKIADIFIINKYNGAVYFAGNNFWINFVYFLFLGFQFIYSMH